VHPGESVGHYTILSHLGSGGMGEVFLAEDTHLDRKVALKLLPVELAKDPDRRLRFITEAKAASALNHPNVCVIHEVDETADQRPFIAMEYIEGRTLDRCAREQRLDVGTIVDVGLQVAEALDAAFEKGIVHRDIKPSNISFTQRGIVKILDFGLAKRLDREGDARPRQSNELKTQAGHVLGTPNYMSPEQALGREVDHRTDLFSLGVVLYELATGRAPFAGTSFGDTINNVVNHEPEPMASSAPDAPLELERITLKCLEKDAGRRYQTPRDLLADFQGLKRGLEGGVTVACAEVTREAVSSRPRPSTPPAESSPISVDALRGSDVFISYASVDDQPLSAERQGWITQFHRDLEVRVEQLSGEPVKIWRHLDPINTGSADDSILKLLPEVKALVSVVSPPFIRSNRCRAEVETFWQAAERAGTARGSSKSRIFKVMKRPVPPADMPPPLSDIFPRLPGFDFFEVDPRTGRLCEYDDSFGAGAKTRYFERVYDVAQEICQVLKESGTGEAAVGDAPPVLIRQGKSIFLAETTADLRADRDRLRRELSERGHTVLPHESLPLDAAELESALEGYLNESDFAVHLVGGRYGLIPEGANDSIVEIQLTAASRQSRHSQLPRLIWMPTGLDPQEDRQAQLIRRVQEDSDFQCGGELVEGGLNSLKNLLLQRLNPPEPARHADTVHGGKGPGRVYLICDQRDEELLEPLQDYLFDEGFEVSLPLFEGSGAEVSEAHRHNLATCDTALVFYGTVTNHWMDMKLMDLVQAAGYGRGKPWAAKAVYVAPPDDRRKARFRTHIAAVIRQSGPFEVTSELREFTDQAKQVPAHG